MDTNSNSTISFNDLYTDVTYGGIIERYRIIFIDDFIDHELIKRCVLQLYKYIEDDEGTPIHIMINSPGGHLDPAFWFISEIELCDCKIITYNTGMAMSAAAKIFLAGDLRVMYPYSSITLHSIRSGKYGVVNNIKNYTDYLDKYNNIVKEYLKRKTKLNDDKIKEILEYDNELTLLADEAIKYGLADQIYLGRVLSGVRRDIQVNHVVAYGDEVLGDNTYEMRNNRRMSLINMMAPNKDNKDEQNRKDKKRTSKKKQ